MYLFCYALNIFIETKAKTYLKIFGECIQLFLLLLSSHETISKPMLMATSNIFHRISSVKQLKSLYFIKQNS